MFITKYPNVNCSSVPQSRLFKDLVLLTYPDYISCGFTPVLEMSTQAQKNAVVSNDITVDINVPEHQHACEDLPCYPRLHCFSRKELLSHEGKKPQLRNCIRQSSFLYLMKIAIETPEKLTDEDLNNIVVIWNRKSR